MASTTSSIPPIITRFVFIILCISPSLLANYLPFELSQLTDVDSSAKNSGFFVADQAESAPIRHSATSDKKGYHISLAASAVRSSGTSNADAIARDLESLASFKADSQSLVNDNSTGKGPVTDKLGPYLRYFSGPIMSQEAVSKPLWIYLIFYGKKWVSKDIFNIKNFIDSITSPPSSSSARHVRNWWLGISGGYDDYLRRNITSDIRLKGEYRDQSSAYPFGTPKQPLTDRNIKDIVSNAILKGRGPPNRKTLYFVLTDEETYVDDFCTHSCSYHSAFRNFGKTIAYAHVGDPSVQCEDKCSFKFFNSEAETVNGVKVDSMVNWLAHELVDLATNPFQFSKGGFPGWVVSNSSLEVADLCEWDFGYLGVEGKGKIYNVEGLDNKKYLIQRNFDRKSGGCKMIAGSENDSPV